MKFQPFLEYGVQPTDPCSSPPLTSASVLVVFIVINGKYIVFSSSPGSMKNAETDRACIIATWQVPVPLHPEPLHPAKVEPPDGIADRVTSVPWLKRAEQVESQLIPAGTLVTVPIPVPILLTVRR